MNDLIGEVTPLTRALVWLRPEELTPRLSQYQALDYLLDGLLTASIQNQIAPSTLLVGESFNRKLYVFMTRKDPAKNELDSFFSLLEKELKPEDRILVVDDIEGRESFLSLVPKKLLSHFHTK